MRLPIGIAVVGALLLLLLSRIGPASRGARVIRVSTPTVLSISPIHRPTNDSALAVRDEVTAALARLSKVEQRQLLKRLVCMHASPGDAALFSACSAHTPSLGTMRRVAKAFALIGPPPPPPPLPAVYPYDMKGLSMLPRIAAAPPPPRAAKNATIITTTTAVATTAPRSAQPPPPPWDWRDHVVGTAPRWLDHVRPSGDDWKDYALKTYELQPMLRPSVRHDELPKCVWERLATLCATLFPRVARKLVGGVQWHASWQRGVHCAVGQAGEAEGGAPAGSSSDHFVKPTSTEAENAILLEDACDDEGSGTRLVTKAPPAGESSLPLEALLAAVGQLHAGAPAAGAGAKMARLRAKLREGRHVRILAIGASNTAMFAPACVEDGCEIKAHEEQDAVAARLTMRAAQHGALGRSQPDWLVRLLLVIHRRYPSASLLGVAQAYGGLDPKSVASCLADFLESGRPFVTQQPRCRACADTSAKPFVSGCRECSDAIPDLLILDFAIYAGKGPDPKYLASIEKLLRFVHTTNAAVILLNMGNWCRGHEGVVTWEVMGHAKCQRVLLDQHRSVNNLRAAAFPDPWHTQLATLAAHYGHVSVSTFHALQPLVIQGAVRTGDFTQDGIHPIYWPRGTDIGHVYVAYIADALAYAVDADATKPRASIWTGRRRPVPLINASAWAKLSGMSRGRSSIAISGTALPAALSPEVDDLKGVRCYGWAGRGVEKKKGNRGAWKLAVRSGVRWPPVGSEITTFDRHSGWALTNAEATFNGTAWTALAKRSKKPGLTSVTPGDAFFIEVDTSLARSGASAPAAREGDVPVLQLTYLQSYEQVGIVRIACHKRCTCAPLVVDTLRPKHRFATLNTALSGAVSRAARCVLRVSNESPSPADGSMPRSKVKLVSLAVLSSTQTRPRLA